MLSGKPSSVEYRSNDLRRHLCEHRLRSLHQLDLDIRYSTVQSVPAVELGGEESSRLVVGESVERAQLVLIPIAHWIALHIECDEFGEANQAINVCPLVPM
jgi:hypothetical protein